MKTLISVTAAHIKRGSLSFHSCPVALAICSVVGHSAAVYVYPSFEDRKAYATINGDRYPLPRAVNRFAKRLDRSVEARKGRAHLKPFTFHLNIPRDMLRPALRTKPVRGP